MKRFYIILVFLILLSGCATYKVQKNKPADEGGFVVSRYGKVIPEYTLGVNNSFPDKERAEERFKRRKPEVEYYYKKMGFIENRFRQVVVEPPLTLVRFIAGIFRMPFILASDYKYNHHPQYKEKIDKLEDEKYNAERARVKELKDKLSEYINKDLGQEPPEEGAQKVILQESVRETLSSESPALSEGSIKPSPVQVEPEVKSVSAPVTSGPEPLEAAKPVAQEKALVVQEELKSTSVAEELASQAVKPKPALPNPNAVIVVKPQNGPSPLKVNFSGRKSTSPNGRIVSYLWDFGDGDKSSKPNPTNTYWSATYGTREFVATLTVTDNKGMVSSSNISIQVINK